MKGVEREREREGGGGEGEGEAERVKEKNDTVVKGVSFFSWLHKSPQEKFAAIANLGQDKHRIN